MTKPRPGLCTQRPAVTWPPVLLQVLQSIRAVNQKPSVHGLMVQLPLDSVGPISTELITNSVCPEKDVDG